MRTVLPGLRATEPLGFKHGSGSRGHGPEVPEVCGGGGDLEVGEEEKKVWEPLK